MTLAYKAEYEQNLTITLDELLAKYSLTYEDLPGCETWTKPSTIQTLVIPAKKPKRVKAIDKILASTIVTQSKQELLATSEPTDIQLRKIESFKELAVEYCLNFMAKDVRFSEVKEFRDIVNIMDSLEKSYQKADPGAGKPTINILINNLMERFSDDC
jgi:hypothetical protein